MMQYPPAMITNQSNTTNLYRNPYGKRRLSPSFQPGCYDVICARGKSAFDQEGNQRFRALVKHHQESYAAATCKYQKSKIVSHIVNTIRQSSQQGGFVKLINGEYFEVGDRAAKEKIGQTFRDLLHNQYSSSTKAKARVRIQRRVNEYSHSPVPAVFSSNESHADAVSVISIESGLQEEVAPMPSFVNVQSTMPPQETVSLLETFDNFLSEASTEAFDFEPLPFEENIVQFHDSELATSSFFDVNDASWNYFCESMGVAF